MFTFASFRAKLRARLVLGARYVCLLVAAILPSAGSISAHAQNLLSSDVIGVAMGMNATQVENVLKAHQPPLVIEKTYWQGPNGKASSSVAMIKAAIRALKYDTGKISGDWNTTRPEAIVVYFTGHSDKAYAIWRSVVDDKGISQDQLFAALQAKYGPNDNTFPGQRVYWRQLNDQGKPDIKCGLPVFDWRTPPTKYNAGCGQAFLLSTSAQKAPGVAGEYTSMMFDHRLAEAEAKAQQAEQEALRNEQNNKALDQARSNKPSI